MFLAASWVGWTESLQRRTNDRLTRSFTPVIITITFVIGEATLPFL